MAATERKKKQREKNGVTGGEEVCEVVEGVVPVGLSTTSFVIMYVDVVCSMFLRVLLKRQTKKT